MAIEVLLFDLGGVLVELGGIPMMTTWTRLEEPEIWRRWLQSEAVRAFESGRSSPGAFAAGVVEEFELEVAPEAFLEAFIAWPKGLFDEVPALLDALREDYHVACLSNTNHLHWERFASETRLHEMLHSRFASHHIGLMKPDPAIYLHTIEALGHAPDEILFFDDNQVNVDSARDCGMNALLARGPGEVKTHLARLGLGPHLL
ncbi:MAG: HAD family phosphatase [Pseudomonadales bacterium]|nr:HAD family phosphatase [Pseudomonadales bacterium]